MQDLLFTLVTLICFGAGHLYVVACDKLKLRPKP
jgi:hypothetical protein